MGSIYENSFFVNDYFELLSIENKIKSKENALVFPRIAPRKIEFRNVSFSYPGTPNLSLKNVSFVINKGEDVAIVGHNGAGKSSLIKLLFRFYDPTEGKILIDGKDLREIELQHWYEHLGVLFQDYARYFLSLRENIEFGSIKEKNPHEVSRALTKAQGADLLKVTCSPYSLHRVK